MFAPIQQGAAASQNLIKLETELEKRKQQLRQQGVMLTPEKPATTEPESATSSGHKPGDLRLPVVGQEHQDNDQDLAKLDSTPEDTLKPYVKKLNGQSFPVVQAWCKTFKKTLGASKYAEFEELVGDITAQVDDNSNKLTKDKSRELAIKFGLPLSVVNKMGVKSLGSVVALASVLAA